MPARIAAIDQGTTGTRCIVFDDRGRPLAGAYAEHRQSAPHPGWLAPAHEEIWAATCRVVA